MNWFGRSIPRDPDALWLVLKTGTYEEFESLYRASAANFMYDGRSILVVAMTNTDTEARCRIAHRLLDDGADATVGDPLHTLLGQSRHDIVREAEVVVRLIAGGADVNRVLGRRGAPIEIVASQFKYSDEDLAPFYDILFAQPDLDLRQNGRHRKPIVDGILVKGELRADLIARSEAYLADRSREGELPWVSQSDDRSSRHRGPGSSSHVQ